jgi:pilus assembly protein TadC
MFSPEFLAAFYTIAGVIVVFALGRMWAKSRSNSQPDLMLEPEHSPPVQPAMGRTAQPSAPQEIKFNPATAFSAPNPSASNLPRMERPASSMLGNVGEVERPTVTPRPTHEHSTGNAVGSGRYAVNMGNVGQFARPLPKMLAEEIPGVDSSSMIFGGATPALASMLPDSSDRQHEIRKELYQAGFYQPHSLTSFSAARYLAMVLPLVFFGILLILVPPRFEPYVVGMIVIGPILGWALPRMYVRSVARDRRSEIEQAMPDLLDMLNMCVSQGMTIPAAIDRVRKELRGAYPALAQELSIVDEQAKISTLDVALKNFSERVDVPEVHSFTSLISQTERMGTSVSQALGDYSDAMREGLKQRAEEKGNRATFRLLFPTVLCLMPAVYLFLLGPAVIELSKFFGAGGRSALDSGTRVIERINGNRFIDDSQ